MCHDIIGRGLIEIQSQLYRNSDTLYIVDGDLIGNRRLYYNIKELGGGFGKNFIAKFSKLGQLYFEEVIIHVFNP